MEYTTSQIALIQRFCDFYRSAPEVLVKADRFVCFTLSAPEIADLDFLINGQMIDCKHLCTNPLGAQDFYRLSDNILPDLQRLRVAGRINLA